MQIMQSTGQNLEQLLQLEFEEKPRSAELTGQAESAHGLAVISQ